MHKQLIVDAVKPSEGLMSRRVAPSCGRSRKLLSVLLQQTSFHFVAPQAIPQYFSFYVYMINLRFDPHQNTFILMYSRWNASGSSALTDITNTSSILTAAPFSFNPSEELKPLWIISDFHVYSFDLFCLLFVIVFQLIYGRCAPSHTRPRTCPHHHSSDNTCSFCLCLCSFDIPSWHCAHGPKTLRTMKPQGEIKSERWWKNTS